MFRSLSIMSGTPKGMRNVFMRPYIVTLVYVETSTLDYVLGICVEILSVIFPNGGNCREKSLFSLTGSDSKTTNNVLRLCKNVQMGLIVDQSIQY